jgi:hypothetical protein
MRLKKKLLLSLGAGATIVTPIATVIACGDTSTKDKTIDPGDKPINPGDIITKVESSAVDNGLNKIQLTFTGVDGKGSFTTPV